MSINSTTEKLLEQLYKGIEIDWLLTFLAAFVNSGYAACSFRLGFAFFPND